MDISVVIPTKNRSDYLNACLMSLTHQVVKPKEIIVVDNGSIDDTKKVVLSYRRKLPVEYLFEPKMGISSARNTGVKKSSGSIIAFLDDDCQAKNDWIKQISIAYQGEVNALQGKSLNGLPNNLFSSLYYLLLERTIRLQVYKAKLQQKNRNLLSISSFFDTKNASIKKDALKKLDYFFDEELKIAGEDVDLGIRLRRAGFEVFYNPKMIVSHFGGDTFVSFAKTRFNRGRAVFSLEKKWQKELKKLNTLKKHFGQRDKLEGNVIYKTEEKVANKLKKEILKGKKIIFMLAFYFFLFLGNLIWYVGYIYQKASLKSSKQRRYR